ncbi:hypothetical protein GB937_001740 [Aspergillus fischeri]|nr:hypothetical protein GB937_001740 [Aspergillus fischeri]
MATTPTASTEEVYLFNRNGFERQSLCNGNLLHPHIPKAAIGRLADIGTGSGIWLDDVAEKLEPDLESTSSLTEREYAGFDISAAHFQRIQDLILLRARLWEAYAAEIDGGVVPSIPLKMILGRKVPGSAS